MTTTAPDTTSLRNRTPRSAADLVASAQELQPLIRANAADNEAAGRLTDDVADALHESGLFGMWTPAPLGGTEADPVSSLQVIQNLAYADPSTAWVTMAAALATGTGGAYLGDEAVATMFRGERFPVVAGQGTRPGTAVREGDGYRLSGSWGFASGIKHAQWIHTLGIVEDTGQPLIFVLPVEQAELSDNWDVLGLKATGSIDYTTDGVYVPASFTHDGTTEQGVRGGTLFNLGIIHFAIIGHSAWALGLSRRMLDDLAGSVRAKAGRPGTLADSTAFQAAYGENEARWHAARALVHDAWRDATETVQAGGTLTDDQRTMIRLALYNATWSAEAIANSVYKSGGTTALRSGPMQQFFRDMHAGTQHVTSGPQVIEGAGKALAGLAPDHRWYYMNYVPRG